VEIYLQHFEDITIKHWTESGEITYYNRYIDDIIFDDEKTNENLICISELFSQTSRI
jgi:hypothetical protein